jgi:hypothetical protein
MLGTKHPFKRLAGTDATTKTAGKHTDSRVPALRLPQQADALVD